MSNETDFDGMPQDNEPEDIALENVLADLGATVKDAVVMVYRSGAKYHGKQAYVGQMVPEEFTLDAVRDAFGPGEYRIHVRGKRDNGRTGLIANRVVVIEESKKKETGPDSGAAFQALQQTLVMGFQELGKLIVSRAQETRPQESLSMKDVLSTLVALKQLDQQSARPQENPMEYFFKGLEVAKTMMPREGEPSNAEVLLEGIRTLGKPIVEMALAQPPAVPMTPQPQPRKVPEMFNPLKLYLRQLTEKAKSGADPGLYADLIIDNLPREEIEKLISGDWFSRVVAMAPDAAPLRPWFEELKTILADFLTGHAEACIGDGQEEEGAPS